ncbi:hypothetical protein OUY22_24020 [Nonomuraea sp. MCN248]|uniref:LPXTG cell wall anchor domain-containing protein n=1 Tax=Nonomuraea corallina TaxID=2989783 RepID=A0ABT4SH01_9ACTN|nr:hypothetical protein [Nonomuraea corallina]MDA0636494.1 hypothetical protein [Nonomuraea corallina]
MSARFSMRSLAVLVAAAGTLAFGSGTAAHADLDMSTEKILLKGDTTASYFWDDGSGRAGDTGLPASGKPMQKGMAASPSWPLLTEGYVLYNGKKAPFFVGDRGPGTPSNRGIMLDLDGKTFADLTGGTFNPRTLMVDGNGGKGHIKVEYVITKWGDGVGLKNHPVAFSTGAWGRMDRNPASPPVLAEDKAGDQAGEKAEGDKALAGAKPDARSDAEQDAPKALAGAEPAKSEAPKAVAVEPVADARPTAGAAAQAAAASEQSNVTGAVVVGGAVLLGGGLVLGRERLRKLLRR